MRADSSPPPRTRHDGRDSALDTTPAAAVPLPRRRPGGAVTRRDEWPTAPSAAVGGGARSGAAVLGGVHGPSGGRSRAGGAWNERPTVPVPAQRGSRRAAAYGGPPVRASRGGEVRGSGDAEPLTGAAAKLLMLVCAGATGITMADTIAGTLAVSAITPAFTGPGMTEADLQWVLTAYAVPFAALLAAAGRLADLVGRRRLLAVGLGLFSLGAAAAAVAMTFPVLLVARAVQGVGSAAVIPASLGLLLAGVPAHRRPGAIGAWMGAAGVGGFTVHAVGGWLLGLQGWRGMFLPSAVIGMLLVYGTLALRRDRVTSGRVPDPVGAVALFAAIGTAVLAITKGPQWGWSPALAALCGGGLLMLFVAVFRSLRHPVPVLAMSLWRTPMFGLSGTVSMLHGLIAFPILIITPLFLHRAWGYGLDVAAPAMAPLSAGVLVTGYVSGKLCKRYGPRAVIYTGALSVAVSCGLIITTVLQPEPRLLTAWVPASILLGVGLGAMTTGASAAGTLSAPPTEYAAAIGGTMTARQIGGAIGTAVAAVLVGRAVTSGVVDGAAVDRALSGYTAVFGGCMVMAGLAGLVAMFIRPQPIAATTTGPTTTGLTATGPSTTGLATTGLATTGPTTTGLAASGLAAAGTAAPTSDRRTASDIPGAPAPAAVSPLPPPSIAAASHLTAPAYPAAPSPAHAPAAASPDVSAPALTGVTPLAAPPASPVSPPAPAVPVAMPLSAPIPGDYEPTPSTGGHTAEVPATTLRISRAELPMPSAPIATPEPAPRPRPRRAATPRSQKAKDRARAESDLRTAATHFLTAADKLAVPHTPLPQYYLPDPAVPEPDVPGPSTPPPVAAEPTATHPTGADSPAPQRPTSHRRPSHRMPYSRGNTSS